MLPNICTSIASWSSLPTRTTWTVFGVNWLLRSWCKTGTQPSRTWRGCSNLLMNQRSDLPFRPFNNAHGWFIGHSLYSSITQRVGTWSLNCSSTRSRIWMPSRRPAPGSWGTCQRPSSSTRVHATKSWKIWSRLFRRRLTPTRTPSHPSSKTSASTSTSREHNRSCESVRPYLSMISSWLPAWRTSSRTHVWWSLRPFAGSTSASPSRCWPRSWTWARRRLRGGLSTWSEMPSWMPRLTHSLVTWSWARRFHHLTNNWSRKLRHCHSEAKCCNSTLRKRKKHKINPIGVLTDFRSI